MVLLKLNLHLASWKDQTIAIHFAIIKTSSNNNSFLLMNNTELVWFKVKKLYVSLLVFWAKQFYLTFLK